MVVVVVNCSVSFYPRLLKPARNTYTCTYKYKFMADTHRMVCVCAEVQLVYVNLTGYMRDKHVHAVLSIQIGRPLRVVQSGSYSITGVDHIHRVCGVSM